MVTWDILAWMNFVIKIGLPFIVLFINVVVTLVKTFEIHTSWTERSRSKLCYQCMPRSINFTTAGSGKGKEQLGPMAPLVIKWWDHFRIYESERLAILIDHYIVILLQSLKCSTLPFFCAFTMRSAFTVVCSPCIHSLCLCFM